MKTLLTWLTCLIGLTLGAQTTIRLPVTVDIPLQTNSSVTYITNVYYINTNVFNTNIYNSSTNITQVITNEAASTTIVTLPTDVIDARLGLRLIRYVQGPTDFTTLGFGAQGYASLYIINPGRFPLTFPKTAWWMGPIPTNQARAVILIESVSGELWWTP